jgi:hypothetical protein
MMQQRFFAEFVNSSCPSRSISLLSLALDYKNMEMVTALTSHDNLDVSNISTLFIDDRNAGLIERLLGVRDKSPKMVAMLEVMRDKAEYVKHSYIMSLFEASSRPGLISWSKVKWYRFCAKFMGRRLQ